MFLKWSHKLGNSIKIEKIKKNKNKEKIEKKYKKTKN